MEPLKIKKKFMCGVCKYKCDQIDNLSQHYEDMHYCQCGKVFYNKNFHVCSRPQQIGGGSTAIVEPKDEEGNLFFQKTLVAFSDTIASYSYDFKDQIIPLVEDATNYIRKPLVSLLKSYIRLHDGIRLKLTFEMLMESPKLKRNLLKKYMSPPIKCMHINFLQDTIDTCSTYVQALCNLLSSELSGLNLITVTKIFITVMRYRPKQARGFLPLPPLLKRKRGILNINEKTGQCFLYSMVAALNFDKIRVNGKLFSEAKGRERENIKRKLEKPEAWASFIEEHQLKLVNERYGEDLSLIDLFENANDDISISIYRISKKEKAIVPCRMTTRMCNNHVTLLLIRRTDLPKKLRKRFKVDMHFLVVYDISAFLALKKIHYVSACRFCGCFYRQPNHETSCYNNDINLIFPDQLRYQYKDMYRMCPPPYIFVYDFLYVGDETNQSSLQVTGFALLGISCKQEKLFFSYYIGENAVNEFFDQLLVNAYYYLDKIQAEQLPLKATASQIEERKRSNMCVSCGRQTGKGNVLCLHHDHYDENKEIQHLCFMCNIKAFPKRQIPVFSFGMSRHITHLLSNLSDKGLKNVYVCPKTSNGTFLSLSIGRDITFFDAEMHFNSTNLHDIMKQLDDDELKLLKNEISDQTSFQWLRKGLPFPHLSIQQVEDFERNQLPPFDEFTDITYLNTFTKKDYDHAVGAYNAIGYTSLREYAMDTLKANVLGLGDVMLCYSSWCVRQFNITSLFDPSIASFSQAACHFYSKTNYQLVQSNDIYKRLSESLVGGLSLCNVREVKCRSPRLQDKDVEPENIVEVLYLDFRSLYAGILGEKTAYGDYDLWNEERVKTFNIYDVDDRGDTWYFIRCSLQYPSRLHALSADLPLAFSRKSVKRDDIKNIYDCMTSLFYDKDNIASSRVNLDVLAKDNIWLSHRNLRLFLNLGMQLTHISEIISYTVTTHLKPFIDRCIEARRTAKNPFYSSLAKAVPNLAAGKFIQKPSSLRVRVCTTQKQLEGMLSKGSFVDAEIINSNLTLVSSKRKRCRVLGNIVLGAHVLFESKYRLYDAVYSYIKPLWRERVTICYVQTDSLILRIRSVPDLYSDLLKLKEIIDFSSVPKHNPLYDNSRAHEPMLLKFEAFYIRHYIGLRSKCYSILEEKPTCINHSNDQTCSLCIVHHKKGIKQQASHEMYVNVLKRMQEGLHEYRTLQQKDNRLLVIKKHRKMLSITDGNRIWISDFESVPVGFQEV